MPTTATKTTKRKASTKVNRNAPASKPVAAAPDTSPAPVPQIQSNIPLSSQLHPGLQVVSAQDFVGRFEALSGQERDAQLMQKRGDVDKAYAIAQGKALEAQVENAKNLVTVEKINTQTAKLSQQQAQTALEGVKAQAIQIDVAGETSLLPLKQQAWDIRAQELAIDNEGAANLLAPRKQHWSLKLQAAQVELDRLQQQVQMRMAEVNAPIEAELLS